VNECVFVDERLDVDDEDDGSGNGYGDNEGEEAAGDEGEDTGEV